MQAEDTPERDGEEPSWLPTVNTVESYLNPGH